MKCLSISAALVLSLAPVVAGQLSMEQARARLAERQAAHPAAVATTQPASAELIEYREIVAKLRAENLQLKAQIAQLKAELKKRGVPAVEAKGEHRSFVDPLKTLRNGMTLAEAETALGEKLDLTGTNATAQQYLAVVPGGETRITVQPPIDPSPRRFNFDVPPPKVVMQTWYWDVMVDIQDGKVANFVFTKRTIAPPR